MTRFESSERIGLFGDYWLLRRLGEVSEGAIWLACSRKDVSARSICALKRPLPFRLAEPESIQRFIDEIRIADLLDHPNISRILDAGSIQGEPFLATEYIEGKSLPHILSALKKIDRPFPLPLAVYLAISICDALSYAHKLTGPSGRQLQLIHRDLKPSSVVISYSGDVKIIEFGMATSRLKEAQTIPGMRTPDTTYQSPEYLSGKPVDPRSDIFSLGVILWELCSGKSPVQTASEQALWLKSGRERFSSPSVYRTGVPQQLNFIVMRALSNNLRDRFQSADEMGDSLRNLLDTLAPGYEETAPAQMAQFMRSMFDSVWLSERHQLMRALQSVQQIPDPAMDASDDDEGDRTVALISLDEMKEFDRSDPFKAKSKSSAKKRPQSSKKRKSSVENRATQAPIASKKKKSASDGSLVPKGNAASDLIRIAGVALAISLAVVLGLILLKSMSGA